MIRLCVGGPAAWYDMSSLWFEESKCGLSPWLGRDLSNGTVGDKTDILDTIQSSPWDAK